MIIAFSIHPHSSMMLQNGLREKFDAKQQQLFELHLQLNGSSRNLFEDLLRKNNEIIKLCLNSFTDAAARLDEYDATFQRLDQEIGKLGDAQSNFHFEFRRTHLEAEKRQAQLTNDVSMLKNALKIPGKDALPEVYLSSDFFKSKVGKVVPRGKDRDLSQGRAKTNFFFPQPRLKDETEAVSECLQAKSIQTDKEDPMQHSVVDSSHQETSHQQKPARKHAYTTMAEQGVRESVQSAEIFLNKQQFRAKLNEVQARIEERLLEVGRSKRQCDWNHIDFDELHRYINEKITEQLSGKVDADYLATSLENLKQAWEGEENELFLQLEGKADGFVLRQLVDRVQALQQIDKVRQVTASGNTAKGKLNLNRSFNCFMALPSSRPASRDNLAESQVLCSRDTRNEEKRDSASNSLAFSNSLGTLKSGRKEKHINIDSLGEFGETLTITQKAWKQRVSELLGTVKVKAKKRV